MRLESALAGSLWIAASQAIPTQHTSTKNPFAVIDPQNYVNPDNMTWEEYVPPPGTNWGDPNVTGSNRNFNIAVVVVDFPDMDFVVTKEPNETVFGNPQPEVSGLDRSEVATYYHDLLNKPQELNRYHTLHEYWMEDSSGRYGVDLTAFGAYRLPAKSFQYGIDNREGGFNEDACPEEPCAVDLRTDALGAWRLDIGNETADAYELAFIIVAGQDESGSWQEFGEMLFESRDDVSDAFGPPDNSSLPNWAQTRYVPWTSWASAASIWPNAGSGSSTQAESSGAGVFAHELSHLIGIGDNYNNPYSEPPRRSYTGPWSMMSRGSFNGPGGPHTRWQIPCLQGSALGSQHTVRDKLELELIDEDARVAVVSRDTLAASGIAVAKLTARAVIPESDDHLSAFRISMDADLSPACNTSLDAFCDGGNYTYYDLEVIQRLGADTFTPASGVMISKSKEAPAPMPFQWTIDAHPEDINWVDFYRPNGTAAMVSIGDYRQLADALFHAGTRSGSEFEHVDETNGLHLYILDMRQDDAGVLHYTVGARSLEGSGTNSFGAELSKGRSSKGNVMDKGVLCEFELSNTGTYSAGNASADASRYFGSDIYRLEAEIDGHGWEVAVPNALAAVGFGESETVGVAVRADGAGGCAKHGKVKLTATSESDGSVASTAWCKVRAH